MTEKTVDTATKCRYNGQWLASSTGQNNGLQIREVVGSNPTRATMFEHQYSVTRIGTRYHLVKSDDVKPNHECPVFSGEYKQARQLYHRLNKYAREELDHDLSM